MSQVQSVEPAETAPGGPAADRAARVLTEVLSPAHLVIAITFLSGLAAPGEWWVKTCWGLAASLFTGIIPYVVGLRAIAKGRLSSRHLPDRRERIRPMAWTLLSVLVGWGLLIAAHAPESVLAVQAAMVAGAVIALAITSVWKISLHAGVAGSAALCACALFGWWLWPVWLLVLAVGWSRVQLHDHTLGQVVAGSFIGTASAAVVFIVLPG